jgi:spermidine/putrescine transport system permease protein
MSPSDAFRRIALMLPALVAILFLVGAPLGLMGWVSLLEKGTSAGVDWSSAPSIGNYQRLIWEEDFDGTLS